MDTAVKTRLFYAGREKADVHLCDPHMNQRLDQGEQIGVPASAAAIMFGLAPFPTGDEACVDCAKEGEAKG